MHPVLPNLHRRPLFGSASTRAIEQSAAQTLPAHTLMRRAGETTARLALALAPHAGRVWVAAGPGNNGGDGLEAALQLMRRGKRVDVTLTGGAARLPADAADALARARAAGVMIDDADAPDGPDGPALQPHDLAIDALLGLGASRAPRGRIEALIERLNGLCCPVLAVDVPSGLGTDTGQPLGPCVHAQHTLALLTLKPGLFTAQGRDHAGRLWFDALDAPDMAHDAAAPDAWLAGAHETAAARPVRRHAQHKGSFGDVAIVGGAPGMTGAALLAARAAHAGGAGRVFVVLLDGGSATHDGLRPELMFRPDWTAGDPATLDVSTVVCGCGGGDAVRQALPRLLSRVPRLVLDADALNAVAADAMLQSLLAKRTDAGRATVLTPHPLEAARMLGRTTASVQADRLAAATELARKFSCVVLLKGSGTVVAAPGQAPSINPTGNAALAGPGTGDVLAGWLGGWWAQNALAGRPDGAAADPTSIAFDTAVAAAYAHGEAADRALQSPLRASDLIEAMHRAASNAGAAG
jgi:hydroxyethylthiazole kinase-like uncharacterized protein yjeF